jgi:hypothetical protein
MRLAEPSRRGLDGVDIFPRDTPSCPFLAACSHIAGNGAGLKHLGKPGPEALNHGLTRFMQLPHLGVITRAYPTIASPVRPIKQGIGGLLETSLHALDASRLKGVAYVIQNIRGINGRAGCPE